MSETITPPNEGSRPAPEAPPLEGATRRTLNVEEIVTLKHYLRDKMTSSGLASVGSEEIVFPADQKDAADAVSFVLGKTIEGSADYDGLGLVTVSTGPSAEVVTSHHLVFAGRSDTETTTAKSQRAMAEADRMLGALESPFRIA